jgi:polar amino acid transport system substrate-binding protein
MVVLSAYGVMGSAPALAEQESALARVERTKVLRIGAVAGAIPYFSKDLASGKWSGFGPDFAESLAGSLGAKVQIVETTWGNAVLDLQSNKIDVMFGMAATPARREMANFSDPLFNNTYTTVCKKGYPDKTWAELNSPDVKISVDVGSSHDNFATSKLPNANLQRLESSGAATMALQTGRVDCQILVVLLAQPLLQKVPTLGEIHVPTPVLSAPVTIGMQKEDDTGLRNAVNSWLKTIQDKGQVKQVILDNMEKLANVKPEAFPKSVEF